MGCIDSQYQNLVDAHTISDDPKQRVLIQKLDHLLRELNRRRSLISRLFLSRKTHKGYYIFGDVGRGKSMIMDLFFEQIDTTKKTRVHFHAFMLGIHEQLHALRKNTSITDPLMHVANTIAKQLEVLCLDELQVTDITDAMILSRLFDRLFDKGMCVVATSNRHPDDLYKDGLQRDQFLPFIEDVKTHMHVYNLDGKLDYRLQHLQSLDTVYMVAKDDKADAFLQRSWDELTMQATPHIQTIDVKGRVLTFSTCHSDVLWTSFAALCDAPLGAEDYMHIAREFGTILFQDIPKMTKEMRNEAKRFVTLIDTLYDHRVKLICTADTDVTKLYEAGDGSFEFERTVSRLIEMQSKSYLETEHLA